MVCPLTGSKHCDCTLSEALRKLFTEHAVYTMWFIVASIEQTENSKLIATRLMKNQQDIGNYLKPMIGLQNASTLIKLLKDHISAAANTVIQLLTGSNKELKQAVEEQFENSDLVAEFLSSLNR